MVLNFVEVFALITVNDDGAENRGEPKTHVVAYECVFTLDRPITTVRIG
jgi:hypothetical protein